MDDRYMKLDAEHSPLFDVKADVLNRCFPLFLENEYKAYQQATRCFKDLNGETWAIWFIQVGRQRDIVTEKGWINNFLERDSIMHSWRKSDPSDVETKWPADRKRIIFTRYDNEPIVFKGVYIFDEERSKTDDDYYKRIATHVDFSVNPPTISLLKDERDAVVIQEIEQLEKNLAETNLSKAEQDIIAKARIGQGEFRGRLLARDKVCKVCGLENRRLLVASHIKPWSKCETTAEKWDENNGLLLCAIHDALFDKGLITFDENGDIQISNSLSEGDQKRLNLCTDLHIDMNDQMKEYLNWHNTDLQKNSNTVEHSKFGIGNIEEETSKNIRIHFSDGNTRTFDKSFLKNGVIRRIF